MRDLKTMTRGELMELMSSLGQPNFRVKQVEDWIWNKNASSFDDMTNLPKSLRAELAAHVTLGGVEEIARQVSDDGSRKYLLKFPDGASVECVGMPNGKKLAVCVSTQAGCRMGCRIPEIRGSEPGQGAAHLRHALSEGSRKPAGAASCSCPG